MGTLMFILIFLVVLAAMYVFWKRLGENDTNDGVKEAIFREACEEIIRKKREETGDTSDTVADRKYTESKVDLDKKPEDNNDNDKEKLAAVNMVMEMLEKNGKSNGNASAELQDMMRTLMEKNKTGR